jgi:DNA polymerase-3 subunit delta
MSIRQLHQELSKGMPAPVYLLYSTDDFLLYEALSAIKEGFGDSSGFNFDVYDLKSPDDSISLDAILDILNTLPFISSRRAVVINNVQKLAKKEVQKLEDYLLNPSITSLLVMLHTGAAPKLFGATLSGSFKSIAVSVQERELPLWIKERAKQKKVRLSDRAAEYLISMTGTDLGMLSAEVEKLACFAGSETGRVIDVDDIKEIVYSGADYSAFNLLDALKRKDAREVFRIFESIAKTQEPQMLLGALNYYYGRKGDKTIGLLHAADIALKTSHKYVMEDLLVKLLSR